MRHLSLSAALALTVLRPIPLSAQQAELGVYHQTLFTKEEGRAVTHSNQYLQGFAYLDDKTGVWGFAYRESRYVSATFGVYYDFVDWFELGAAAGLERLRGDDDRARTFGRWAGSLWLGTAETSLTLYYENGASKEYWYQLDAMWRPRRHFGAGVFAQRYAGVGPRVLVRPPKIPLEVWIAPAMYDRESRLTNRLLGVQLLYQKEKAESSTARAAPPRPAPR